MLGKNVTISDNSHGHNDYSELKLQPIDRPLCSKGRVHIGKNVWIGDKATILPGVNVGAYSIIGSNSVVTKDIPPYSVACGNPARIVRQITPD